jgi:hypothetical protein
MKKNKQWLAPVLLLALAACGGDPVQPAMDALAARDFASAEKLSGELAKKKPKLNSVHVLRFVLYRHLAVQGDPSKQSYYVQDAIVEYDLVAKALGITANYADMEGSLRSNPESAALLAAARKPLYGE